MKTYKNIPSLYNSGFENLLQTREKRIVLKGEIAEAEERQQSAPPSDQESSAARDVRASFDAYESVIANPIKGERLQAQYTRLFADAKPYLVNGSLIVNGIVLNPNTYDHKSVGKIQNFLGITEDGLVGPIFIRSVVSHLKRNPPQLTFSQRADALLARIPEGERRTFETVLPQLSQVAPAEQERFLANIQTRANLFADAERRKAIPKTGDQNTPRVASASVSENTMNRYVSVRSGENLRNPSTNAIVRRASPGETFQIVGDLPAQGRYQYKLVQGEREERFKICVNDGQNVQIVQNPPSRESQSPALVGEEQVIAATNTSLKDPEGSMVINRGNSNLQIHEIVPPDGQNTIWIKIPKDIAISKNLPKDTYLPADKVGNTFVYRDFPEYGQVRVKEGMVISREKPPDNQVYAKTSLEPIPTNTSLFPQNPRELAEIAKRCPVAILHSGTKGEAGKPWGHTALEINGKVYSYGRWGKTDQNLGTTGDGILYVFDSLQAYKRSERSNVERVPLYGIDASQRTEMERFYMDKLRAGSTIDGYRTAQVERGEEPTRKIDYVGASEYVIDPYDVFDQNCTTLTLSALEAGGGRIGKIARNLNVESSPLELWHDGSALFTAARSTLSDLNINLSSRAISVIKSLTTNGTVDPEIIPVTEDGLITGTGSQFDGKHLVDVFYRHLTEAYGNETTRLPENLYAALTRSPTPEISRITLSRNTG
jgi:hypothetical protein